MRSSGKRTGILRVAVPAPADFHRRFGVGRPDRIAPVDACGVMLAAVQGLAGEWRALAAEVRSLRRALRTGGSGRR